MKISRIAGFLIACASLSSAATVTLTGVNGVSDGADFVLPYELSIDGVLTAADCYDFFDGVSIGQTWEAELLTIDQAAEHGRFSASTDALHGYQLVAALSSLATFGAQDQIDLQHAIWSVFDPGVFAATAGVSGYLSAAESQLSTLDYGRFRFVEAAGVQTFVIDPPSETPEPSTLALFGGGLLLMLGRNILSTGTKANVPK